VGGAGSQRAHREPHWVIRQCQPEACPQNEQPPLVVLNEDLLPGHARADRGAVLVNWRLAGAQRRLPHAAEQLQPAQAAAAAAAAAVLPPCRNADAFRLQFLRRHHRTGCAQANIQANVQV